MPQPSASTTIRPDLAAFASEFAMSAVERGFIADRVLPVFETGVRSSEFPKINAKEFLGLPGVERAPNGAYNRGDWEYEPATYACKEYGWEERIDDGEAQVFSRYGDAEEVATVRATSVLLRHREKRVADMLFSASTFTVHNVSTTWDTAATATPRADVLAGLKAVRDNTGLLPNVFVCSWNTFQNIIMTDEFKDWVKYTNAVVIEEFEAQRRLVARYLGVGEVLVGNSVYDSANKGLDLSVSDIWSDSYGLLARVATSNMDLKEPCIGRTFLWTADSPDIVTVEMYRDESVRSDIVRVRHYLDEQLVFTGAGYLLGNLSS